MKAKGMIIALVSTLLISATNIMAQTVDLEVRVKGIEKAEGNIMIALGNLENPQQMFTGIKEVKETGELVFVLQGVPDGWETDLNVLQDLNGDTQLQINANGVPTEPCATTKVKVSTDNPVVEITLMDVMKMIGG